MMPVKNVNSFRDHKIRRKIWLKVHLYIGLFAGTVFVLIGLAGSLSVFWPEIDSELNPALKKIQSYPPQADYRSLDEIAVAAKAVIPRQGKPYALVFPARTDEAFSVTYSLPAQTLKQSEWHLVYVNPYNARVLGQRLMFDTGNAWRGNLMNFFVRFHYSLALGEAGRTFVGIVALFLLFSVLTGLIVWWPSSGKIRRALTIKRHASAERFNFDLHKTFGFYCSIVLLVVLASGIEMVFPGYADGLVKVFLPLTPKAGAPMSAETSQREPITLVQAAAITDKRFPDGVYKWIFFPQGERDAYRIVKGSPQEVNRTRPRRTLWLDQYSGKIVQERDPMTDAAGDVFLQWLYPLHNGEAFGLSGRIIIAITGLVPLLLYVTGVIRWLQKRKAKKNLARQVSRISSLVEP
ncbi:putative iron-regulated membrane protein [Methylobacter tundripaludum]|uniref:Putative iron-regulated membrane protein n=1 Tax=Methylobacter tundripaludum TaxID=173365 RepID=A0A2S6GQ52_9GAMM|nr:putative iron-regulated membrane protein [Methylobacter tundripaludum]